jgi:hypothetical protein
MMKAKDWFCLECRRRFVYAADPKNRHVYVVGHFAQFHPELTSGREAGRKSDD